MRYLIIFLVFVLPAYAVPDQQLSPDAFEQYVTGKTLYYGEPGARPYGAEEYLPGRRVRWSFLNGECIEGQWFVDMDLICFVYEDNPEPQCWSFYKDGGGIVAMFENDPNSTTLYELQNASEPLRCLGPDVGV
ncbi:hypothetical protein [Parasulfitobacter algicola]|uniref:Uncharacterized protein n=1 Tax=Parasulfitobacter algicola TaxID=2614809 RepID=A0ABX2IU95_9RHOB|nr:hypothetical protein [Sulfitobacter algicola]NSX56474.1 hypothetical protein [Sulfitobacter algicola]